MSEDTVNSNSDASVAEGEQDNNFHLRNRSEATEQEQETGEQTAQTESASQTDASVDEAAVETDASTEAQNEEPKELSPEDASVAEFATKSPAGEQDNNFNLRNRSEATDKLEALEKENAELKDQLLRRAADFDNYRKRMIKEKQDAYDYANAALLQDLLESLDNLERTIAAAENATDAKSIADGVKMISTSLMNMLENKYNLVPFGAAGDAFNPEEHEALRSEQEEVESPVLKEVYLKGYKLKDRVIRNAKVAVSMPK